MEVLFDKDGDKLIVSIVGRMDAVTAPEFDQQIDGRLADGEKHLIVDLSRLDYISSAGLRSMLSMAKKLKQRQGELILCGLSGVVKEVFEVSGFSSIFNISNSLEEVCRK